MIPAILPHDETERLIALRRLQILDTAPEDSFERVTTLAARIFEVPIAVISLCRYQPAVVQVLLRAAGYGSWSGDCQAVERTARRAPDH